MICPRDDPTHSRRRPGRQRISFISYLQKFPGDAENDVNPDAIASLISFRSLCLEKICSRLLRSRMMMMVIVHVLKRCSSTHYKVKVSYSYKHSKKRPRHSKRYSNSYARA